MLDQIASTIHKFLSGDTNAKELKEIQILVDQINALEPEMQKLSDGDLQYKTEQFRTHLKSKLEGVKLEKIIADDIAKMPGQIRTSHDKVLAAALEEILVPAFAVCREAAKRVLNMRHFDVQLIGGVQLHRGGIAEMQTGEGKTLVCTLAAYLNALTGRGVHIVTVNDYLAQRDSEWMGKLYKFLGLSVGLVIAGKSHEDRQEAYACDICYGTNNEFGFDYLRDNMETSLEACVQRDYYMAIVDEVDSILIDEARTPLIVSGLPDASRQELYVVMAKLAGQLKQDRDYQVDEKAKNIILTDAGVQAAEKALHVTELWDAEMNYAHHLIQALKAKELFVSDVDYIVRKDPETKRKEVCIVDEFTGRLMEGRRWSDGLHQAVEAKEGVKIQDETLTMASITFQNLFRLYPKLAGMTGTAMTEAEEFNKIYNLSVLAIPTNRPNVRKKLDDVVYKNERSKFFAIAEDIVQVHQEGRPVLVGTTSIDKSELVAAMLTKPAIAMEIFIARAARLAAQLNKHKIALPEFAKYIDRPGNVKYEELEKMLCVVESKDDDLNFAKQSLLTAAMVLSAIRRGLKVSVLNAKHHEKEANIIRQAGKPGAITIATNMAGRGTDIVLGGYLSNQPGDADYDTVDKEAQFQVKDNGGLHVIGTERHESRRIDNQLRGRTGRQGDPGSSRFYLSLEDNLMRIFGGERIASVMNLLNADEDLPIEAPMVSGAINNAQKKVEAHNFDIRKHVLQYDDVINTQREVVYRERREILEGSDLSESVSEMVEDQIEDLLYSHISPNTPVELWFDDSQGPSSMEQVFELLKQTFGEEILHQLSAMEDYQRLGFDALLADVKAAAVKLYEEREVAYGPAAMREAERQIMLHNIDNKWIEHIHAMDSLKDGIHLQSYGQKDPLIEYKKEAFDMFDTLLANIKRDTVTLLYHAHIVVDNGETEKRAALRS